MSFILEEYGSIFFAVLFGNATIAIYYLILPQIASFVNNILNYLMGVV